MNITVYLGSNEGNVPAFLKAADELGTWIGSSGNTLVYGGSKIGLMGRLASHALAAGGKVIGVEPQFFMEEEVQLNEVTELIVTQTMAQRKAKMVELGDAFIAFPGATGTLEEISEIMARASLNRLDAPCIIYNLCGYYDSLKELLNHMIETGLSSREHQKDIHFASNLDEVVAILQEE